MLAPETQVLVDDMDVILLLDFDLLSPRLLASRFMGWSEDETVELVGRRALHLLHLLHLLSLTIKAVKPRAKSRS